MTSTNVLIITMIFLIFYPITTPGSAECFGINQYPKGIFQDSKNMDFIVANHLACVRHFFRLDAIGSRCFFGINRLIAFFAVLVGTIYIGYIWEQEVDLVWLWRNMNFWKFMSPEKLYRSRALMLDRDINRLKLIDNSGRS